MVWIRRRGLLVAAFSSLLLAACGTTDVRPEPAASTAARGAEAATAADWPTDVLVPATAVTAVTATETTAPDAAAPCPAPSADSEAPPDLPPSSYAAAYGISLEEAAVRLGLQSEASLLEAHLQEHEPVLFAGVLIQNEPEFRFVVLMKPGGEALVAQHTAMLTCPAIVIVETVAYSAADLLEHQDRAAAIAEELEMDYAAGGHLREQIVDLYVADAAEFERRRAAAGLALPPTVRIVEIPNPDATPEPTPPFAVKMPTKTSNIGDDDALLSGTLVLNGSCLQVDPGDGVGITIVWPNGAQVGLRDGVVAVVEPHGEVFARVGDWVEIGGGMWGGGSVEGCPGDAWGGEF